MHSLATRLQCYGAAITTDRPLSDIEVDANIRRDPRWNAMADI